MPREIANVRTGNHIRATLDGITVGLIQSIQANDDYGLEPASGVGSIQPAEYYPTMARHSLSISFMVLRTELIVARGFIPENGAAAMRGLVFDIEIFDKRTSELIKKYINVAYGSGSLDINAHRAIVRNGSFMALDTSGKI